MLIDFNERPEWMVNGGGEGGEMVREVKIGKWSEGEISVWVIEGERGEFLVVMTRSRM